MDYKDDIKRTPPQNKEHQVYKSFTQLTPPKKKKYNYIVIANNPDDLLTPCLVKESTKPFAERPTYLKVTSIEETKDKISLN